MSAFICSGSSLLLTLVIFTATCCSFTLLQQRQEVRGVGVCK